MVRAPNSARPANPNRYFPSARDILIIRFDPGNIAAVDVAEDDEVFDESDLDTDRALRGPGNTLGIDENFFSDGLVLNLSENFFDRRGSPLSSTIQDAFDQNKDLASAIARVNFEDEFSKIIDIQPLSSDRTVNGHRLADELNLRISWKDVPFDARIIRAMLVLHFEGTVPARNFERGQRSRGTIDDGGYLVDARRSNLRFIGLVDQISSSHNASDDSVNLKCRDLTAVLLDTKLPKLTKKTIRSGQNVLEVVDNLLNTLQFTAAEFIRGPVVRPAGTPLPALNRRRYDKLKTTAASRNRAAAANASNGTTDAEPHIIRNTTKGGNSGESYWDAITDLCVSHGLVPFIELDQLVIQPPRTLFTQQPEVIGSPGIPKFPTPYRNSIGDVVPIRRMIYGSNLEGVSFQRKLSRIKAPYVRVLSYVPNGGPDSRLIEYIHPPRTPDGRKVSTRIGVTGQQKQIEIQQVLVYGIVDPDLLQNIAEAAYEMMGRQHLSVKLQTHDLASFSDHPLFDPNEDPDLLDLRAGDPIRLEVISNSDNGNAFLGVSELNKIIARSRRVNRAVGGRPEFTDAVRFLRAKGYSEEDAQQLVSLLVASNLENEFRVNTMNISMDLEGGDTSIQIDARNYIKARADPGYSGRRVPRRGAAPIV